MLHIFLYRINVIMCYWNICLIIIDFLLIHSITQISASFETIYKFYYIILVIIKKDKVDSRHFKWDVYLACPAFLANH